MRHGTNPASAHLAGFEAITIKSDGRGLVDLADFKAKLERPDGRVHDDQPQHGRALRPSDRRDRQRCFTTAAPCSTSTVPT